MCVVVNKSGVACLRTSNDQCRNYCASHKSGNKRVQKNNESGGYFEQDILASFYGVISGAFFNGWSCSGGMERHHCGQNHR